MEGASLYTDFGKVLTITFLSSMCRLILTDIRWDA